MVLDGLAFLMVLMTRGVCSFVRSFKESSTTCVANTVDTVEACEEGAFVVGETKSVLMLSMFSVSSTSGESIASITGLSCC